MKRVRRLGDATFRMNSMFVREFLEPESYMTSVAMSAAGSRIVWVQRISTPYRTIFGGEHGWIDDETASKILDMWENAGATYDIEYTDGSIETVRMAVEKRLVITPLYDGAQYHTVEIPTEKI